MSFQPVFENITINEKAGVFTENLKIECKTLLSTESVKKIIFLSANPYLLSSECVEDGVKFNGKINFFICYADQDGQVKKHECASEFNGVIKTGMPLDECRARVEFIKEKTDCDLSGLYLTPSSTIQAVTTVKRRKDIPFVASGEGFFSEEENLPHLKSLGEKSVVYPIEEEFELPYTVSEVLSQNAVATVSACQCGVGVVIVDGEVNISQIFLQSGDKKDIIKESRTFPFRAEIECEDAMPSFIAVASLTEKSFRTDISVDENTGRSVVNASIALSLTGEAFLIEEIAVIKDAFSLDNEIELVREKVPCKKGCEQVVLCEKITGRVEFEDLPVGGTFCLATCERADILSAERVNGGILINGSMSAVAVFTDGDGNAFSRKMETPFTANLPLSLSENATFEVSAKVKGVEERILSLSSGELTLNVCFNILVVEKGEVCLVREVKQL